MSKRVKKGSALIWTLAITSILIVFAISLLSISSSNRITTVGLERSSQLKLIAQTGMSKSLSTLKEAIVQKVISDGSNNSILYDFASNPEGAYLDKLGLDVKTTNIIHGTTDGYSTAFNIYNRTIDVNHTQNGDCYVAYTEVNNYEDQNDQINKDCIKIDVYAYGRGGSRRVETAYIDKNSISNYYFEKMFHNAITVLGDASNNINGSIESSSGGQVANIRIGGDVYLQGDSFNVSSVNDMQINGRLKVNRPDLSHFTPPNNNLKFYDYGNYINDISPSFYLPTFSWMSNRDKIDKQKSFVIKEDTTIEKRDMRILPILEGSTITATDTLDELLKNNNFKIVKDTAPGASPAMIIAKCKPNGNESVDFNQIVLGKDLDSHTGLRRFIANHNASNNELNTQYKDEFDLLKVYKVIIVGGDLTIDAARLYYDQITDNDPEDIIPSDFREMRMMNYIVISSGTVTIKGTFNMYNSSILAKKVVFQPSTMDMPTAIDENGDTVCSDSAVSLISPPAVALHQARISQGETSDSIATTDPNYLDDPSYLKDPLRYIIDSKKNYIDSSILAASNALGTAYENARIESVPTTVSMFGIGTDDSIREILKDWESYNPDAIPSDTRGYLDNIQKAVMNEALIRNLSVDYAKQLKFKIIDWQER